MAVCCPFCASNRKESRWILVAEEIRETLLSSKFFMNLVGIFFMLVTFTYSTSQPLSLSIAVTSIAIFNSLQLIVVAVGGPAILGLMESKVALSRIEVLHICLCVTHFVSLYIPYEVHIIVNSSTTVYYVFICAFHSIYQQTSTIVVFHI